MSSELAGSESEKYGRPRLTSANLE